MDLPSSSHMSTIPSWACTSQYVQQRVKNTFHFTSPSNTNKCDKIMACSTRSSVLKFAHYIGKAMESFPRNFIRFSNCCLVALGSPAADVKFNDGPEASRCPFPCSRAPPYPPTDAATALSWHPPHRGALGPLAGRCAGKRKGAGGDSKNSVIGFTLRKAWSEHISARRLRGRVVSLPCRCEGRRAAVRATTRARPRINYKLHRVPDPADIMLLSFPTENRSNDSNRTD